MGDYNFGVASAVSALSPVEFQHNSSSTSLFFNDSLSHNMQDDLLLEKSPAKQNQQLSPNSEHNGDHNLSDFTVRKLKDEDLNCVHGQEKKHDSINVTSPLQLGYASEANGAITSAPNFWSNATADDAFIQGIPALNGSLTFQNFSPAPNSLFNAGIGPGPQISIPQQQQAPQRRAITATHNFPQQRHQLQQPNLFLPTNTKPFSNWSAPQQSTWSAPQTQPPLSPWNSLNPRRTVPNLAPMLSMKKPTGLGQQCQQQPNVISTSKFRRSTSMPTKTFPHPMGINPAFEIAGMEDNRDVPLLPFQDRHLSNNAPSPLDTLRLSTLEHYLNDIMRSTDNQDHMKGYTNCNANTLQSLAQMHGKSPFFTGLDDNHHLLDDGNLDQSVSSPTRGSPRSQCSSDPGERFSRKVFVGGLPPDIDEEEITASFRRFGPLVVDWPHKAESKSYFPPKGYAFLLFQDECSVQNLIDSCIQDDDKLYLCVSSPTIKDKPVQIRPWRLSDADFVLDASLPLDPRKTVFVGGVPRPLKAVELAMIMDRLYGGVCYAGIDTDPELKYPKGAGRVAFSNQQSYIAAISARFVQLQHGDIDKRVEVKPYVLDDQLCDECQGARCGGKFAPFFCANVTCLQYYCETCWATIHSRPGREFHKPLVKEGADRPRAVPFRWC